MSNVSAASFSASIFAWCDKWKVEAVDFVQDLALETNNRVVARTPVDTGRAAEGWDVCQGQPSDYLPPEVPADVQAQREAMRKAGITPPRLFPEPQPPDVSGLTLDAPIYVTSRVPYVPQLEAGSSQKSPQGMVAVTVAELEQEITSLVASVATKGGATP